MYLKALRRRHSEGIHCFLIKIYARNKIKTLHISFAGDYFIYRDEHSLRIILCFH